MNDQQARIAEIRQDNRMGDVSYHDIVWLLGVAEAANQLAVHIPRSEHRWLVQALERRRPTSPTIGPVTW